MTLPDPLEETLALERQVWNALVACDAEADRALLHPDFLGVYETGFANRDEHTDLGDTPRFISYEITEPHLIEVSESARLLCYRADYTRAGSNSATEASEVMYISSLWTKADGTWTNRFSQDTMASRPDSGS